MQQSWGRWGLMAGVLLCSGCSSNTAYQTVSNPVTERRTRLDTGPFVTSDWTLDGETIVGHVSWAACTRQRSWTTEQRRVVHRQSIPAVGWSFIAAGATLGAVGLATHKAPVGVIACSDDPQVRTEQMLYGDQCGGSQPDNTASTIELVSGLFALGIGIGALAIVRADNTTTLKSDPHFESTTEPCITPEDLATLVLVLELGKGRFLHVAVSSDGRAEIALPLGTHLPQGRELPIVVYRAPATAKAMLSRWQVVGVVHVP